MVSKRTKKPPPLVRLERMGALTANILILGVVVWAWAMEKWFFDAYYQAVQEDQTMEWATFWAFFVGAGIFVIAAVRQRKSGRGLPWFLAGLALFCFIVAMEEISWGQRLAGYRPPDYFLEKNFQQELNLHNVTSTSARKLALKAVILGYGVLLPLLALAPALRRQFAKLSIITPPLALAPSFLAAYFVYEVYPWKFSGEWVELMVGFGFLFAALIAAWQMASTDTTSRGDLTSPNKQVKGILMVWAVAMVLGGATSMISRIAYSKSPERVAMATTELKAIESDFRSRRVTSRCDLHKRLFSFMEKYDQYDLLEGEFSRLTDQGLPDSRAQYLIDPWNSPYWLRDRCRDDRRVTFVYSFGPNRKRDSSQWEILGDDVGVYIRTMTQ